MFSPSWSLIKFRSYALGSLCAFVVVCALVSALMKQVAANNQRRELYALVSIDGVEYGRLGNFADLHEFFDPTFTSCQDSTAELCSSGQNGVLDLDLHHTFIAEKSLFQWAQDHSRNPNSQARDVDIILCNQYGDEVDKITLIQTKPSSWSIEAAESSSGGFSETIQVFVQDIIHGPL